MSPKSTKPKLEGTTKERRAAKKERRAAKKQEKLTKRYQAKVAEARKKAEKEKASEKKEEEESSDSDSDSDSESSSEEAAKVEKQESSDSGSESGSESESESEAEEAKAEASSDSDSDSSDSDSESSDSEEAKASEESAKAEASSSSDSDSSDSDSSDSSDESSSEDKMDEDSDSGKRKADSDVEMDDSEDSSAKQKKQKTEGEVASVFVGNLPFSATTEALKDTFAEFGEVVDARIAMDNNTGRARGFGYVDFASEEARDKALGSEYIELEGRQLRVDTTTGRAGRSDAKRGGDKPASEPSKTLFMGNMSFYSTEDSVREAFAECGEVVSVRLITDRETGRPKGFGYIEFDSLDSAANAMKWNGSDLDGRNI
ncbi:hypothetical protein LPJ70_006588, partial [Coemansia sp. RSA 2708]